MKTASGKIDELVVEFGVPAEEIACYGCRSEQLSKDWCRDCFIKTCCREKGIDTCVECNDYPCKDLIVFRERKDYPVHKEHEWCLDLIKKQGKEAWLTSMKKRWSCKNCQTPFNWSQQKCENCGSKVDGINNLNKIFNSAKAPSPSNPDYPYQCMTLIPS
jgi:hypothetical protein